MTEEEKRKRDKAERMLQDKYRNAGKSERSVRQRENRVKKREARGKNKQELDSTRLS